jgi:hypothetical protein
MIAYRLESAPMRPFLVLTFTVGLLGCRAEVDLKSAPVSVAGKVSQGGQPIGGMVMVFQPLGDGHVREVPIQKDGTFNGEMISGKYAYYVARPAVPAVAQAFRKLAPTFFEADLSRTVVVEPDAQLAIALD